MEIHDLGHVLIDFLSASVKGLQSVASCLLTSALALLGFLTLVALILSIAWIYVHVVIILFEYCHLVFNDIIRYLSSWFLTLSIPSSSIPPAIEDSAPSVKSEPQDDDDNNDDDDDIPPLRDPSPQVSETSETRKTPPPSPQAKRRESATRFAIIASAFPSEQKDKSLTPPYICDEYQCTFPYPCTEQKAKKPRSTPQAKKSLH